MSLGAQLVVAIVLYAAGVVGAGILRRRRDLPVVTAGHIIIHTIALVCAVGALAWAAGLIPHGPLLQDLIRSTRGPVSGADLTAVIIQSYSELLTGGTIITLGFAFACDMIISFMNRSLAWLILLIPVSAAFAFYAICTLRMLLAH